jgi:Glycosyl hydrolase family 76
VPLFETVDETALASPTAANENRVVAFANYAEGYWDRNVTPAPGVHRKTPAYAPYPGSWSNVETFFDDDGWWGLAFMDASQAMRQSGRARLEARYLADAQRAFTLISRNGWDATDGGGIWWNTDHVIPGGHGRSGEALAAATDLAARLYQATGQPRYLQVAENYITWANQNLLASDGNYGLQIPNASVMPSDGQGAMVAAFTALCEARASVPPSVYAGIPPNRAGGADPSYRLPADPTSWCSWAQALAGHTAFGITIGGATFDAYVPLNDGPQWDDIYVRGLLCLYGYDHDSRWYGVAAQTAQRILDDAQSPSGVFLKAWNGSSSVPGSVPGMLQTDASSLSVLAALAGAAPTS